MRQQETMQRFLSTLIGQSCTVYLLAPQAWVPCGRLVHASRVGVLLELPYEGRTAAGMERSTRTICIPWHAVACIVPATADTTAPREAPTARSTTAWSDRE
jgi:hypothetical protein